MWTENFQMSKLDLEKAEEPQIKLPTFDRLWRKQENSRKTSTSALLMMLNFWLCGSQQTWKILKEIGEPDLLTYLLGNVYACQEATVRTWLGKTDWFQIGKGVQQGCILSPCLFKVYAEYIMWSAELDESQAGIKISGEISTSDTQMIPL